MDPIQEDNFDRDLTPAEVETITAGLSLLQQVCHGRSKAAGWHNKPREDGTQLMLIVSEVAECMEGCRKNLMDDKLPHRSMAEVEMADAVIRIGDFSGAKNFDLVGAVLEKLEFNRHRPDHKLEVRAAEGGKAW